MSKTKPESELVEATPVATDSRHTWIRPVFDFDDLCCEVTMYLHNRR